VLAQQVAETDRVQGIHDGVSVPDVSALQEIEARLTAPGAPFEVVEERVLGERMRVFKQRAPSLRALLEASATHGEKEYLVCGDLRLSYAEHLRVVASAARALRERFHVGPGDRVAILAANHPEWIVGFWATLSLGAIAVGLNAWWVRDEILHGLRDSEPKVLIGDRKRLARIAGVALDIPVVEIESDFAALWNHAPEAPLPDVAIDEDDAATILYTSGTTGPPKGAVISHRSIIALVRLQVFHGVRMALHAAASGRRVAAAPPACNLVNTPLFHVSGLFAGVVTSLATGIRTVWTPGRFDPVGVMEVIERERVTAWGPMGTMVHRLVHHPDVGRHDLSSVHTIGSGGAPLSRELQERIREVFPNARPSFGVGYGLTESTALATLNFGEELEARPDSVGRPLPTIELEIRDLDGKRVPEGELGEVYLRGPLVMKEYWRRPEATAETVGPGRWLRTGDVGRIQDAFLTIDSRRRDLILRGGENVHPAEIELCLEAHPEVAEAAVVGVDHPELGQEVKAFVVPVAGAVADPEALARWVGERLAYFKVPAHWELRSEPLPRNATGKVLKAVLTDGAVNPFAEE
jgi:long-chain acyl-CoA synthetase